MERARQVRMPERTRPRGRSGRSPACFPHDQRRRTAGYQGWRQDLARRRQERTLFPRAAGNRFRPAGSAARLRRRVHRHGLLQVQRQRRHLAPEAVRVQRDLHDRRFGGRGKPRGLRGDAERRWRLEEHGFRRHVHARRPRARRTGRRLSGPGRTRHHGGSEDLRQSVRCGQPRQVRWHLALTGRGRLLRQGRCHADPQRHGRSYGLERRLRSHPVLRRPEEHRRWRDFPRQEYRADDERPDFAHGQRAGQPDEPERSLRRHRRRRSLQEHGRGRILGARGRRARGPERLWARPGSAVAGRRIRGHGCIDLPYDAPGGNDRVAAVRWAPPPIRCTWNSRRGEVMLAP